MGVKEFIKLNERKSNEKKTLEAIEKMIYNIDNSKCDNKKELAKERELIKNYLKYSKKELTEVDLKLKIYNVCNKYKMDKIKQEDIEALIKICEDL